MKKILSVFFLTFTCLVFSAENETPQVQSSQAKKAIIFGVTGQDGAYLTEFLLDKGYEVHGVRRRVSSSNTTRIDQLYQQAQKKEQKFLLHFGDLADACSIFNIIQTVKPDEIYNLAAQSMVKDSFELPEYTADVNALGTLRILEAIRQLGLAKKTKFYQASTSELYGMVREIPQTEDTPFYPRSPYAVSKLFAYWITVNYREAYDIFACNGILFNHESPLRGETFVTRKITQAASRIKIGLQDDLSLGNLDAKRDWGYAKDYVEAMWHILQQEKPQDFVVATGENHTVREFVEIAFKELGMEIEWKGQGVEEVGLDKNTKRVLVKIDPRFFRPSEVEQLIGNANKAKKFFKWEAKTKFEDLVKIMIKADYTQTLLSLKASETAAEIALKEKQSPSSLILR
jgi:GDPmannose 4,6-dehydratase